MLPILDSVKKLNILSHSYIVTYTLSIQGSIHNLTTS